MREAPPFPRKSPPLALLLGAVFLIASPSTTAFAQQTPFIQQLKKFLESQNRHLEEGNFNAYLNAFADSTGARARQSTFLALMRTSPARNLRLRLTSPQTLILTQGTRIENASVIMEYEIPDRDTSHAFQSPARCDFLVSHAGQNWNITKFDFERQTPFWLLGLSESTSTDHFLLFFNPRFESPESAGETGRQLERAYKKLTREKYLQLADRYPVFLVPREDHFKKITAMDPGRFGAATSSTYQVVEGGFAVRQRALYINNGLLLSSGPGRPVPGRDQTLLHEMVHLALVDVTRPYTPTWLVEGTAVCLAGQRSTASRQALRVSGALQAISLSGLSRGALPGSRFGSKFHLNLEYQFAAETVAFLMDQIGREKFFEFYRSFSRIPSEELRARIDASLNPQPGDPAPLPKIMHLLTLELTPRHCGFDLYELDRRVKNHLAAKAF